MTAAVVCVWPGCRARYDLDLVRVGAAVAESGWLRMRPLGVVLCPEHGLRGHRPTVHLHVPVCQCGWHGTGTPDTAGVTAQWAAHLHALRAGMLVRRIGGPYGQTAKRWHAYETLPDGTVVALCRQVGRGRRLLVDGIAEYAPVGRTLAADRCQTVACARRWAAMRGAR